jgi:hypothetical protein
LPFADGKAHSTGLSRPQVLTGDPRVAALVLAAVVDYQVYQSAGRRENLEYVTDMFSLLKEASDAIGREPSGAEKSASRPRAAASPGTRQR